MQLSNRLMAVAGLVTPGNRVADIGCDHAYTSIYLAENNIAPHIIAMDINRGPLGHARENIEKFGQTDRIEIRRSDGLQKLNCNEADTILIAGMGGRLTLKILEERQEVVSQTRELVLQPQSEIHLVRRALSGYGFLITAENMLKEDGKYYMLMKAEAKAYIKDESPFELTQEEQFYFGRLPLEQNNPSLYEFLIKEKRQCEGIYETLSSNPTDQTLRRRGEITEKIRLIDNGLRYYKNEE